MKIEEPNRTCPKKEKSSERDLHNARRILHWEEKKKSQKKVLDKLSSSKHLALIMLKAVDRKTVSNHEKNQNPLRPYLYLFLSED